MKIHLGAQAAGSAPGTKHRHSARRQAPGTTSEKWKIRPDLSLLPMTRPIDARDTHIEKKSPGMLGRDDRPRMPGSVGGISCRRAAVAMQSGAKGAQRAASNDPPAVSTRLGPVRHEQADSNKPRRTWESSPSFSARADGLGSLAQTGPNASPSGAYQATAPLLVGYGHLRLGHTPASPSCHRDSLPNRARWPQCRLIASGCESLARFPQCPTRGRVRRNRPLGDRRVPASWGATNGPLTLRPSIGLLRPFSRDNRSALLRRPNPSAAPGCLQLALAGQFHSQAAPTVRSRVRIAKR